MLSPHDVLFEAIGSGCLFERHPAFQKPGSIIERMSPEKRVILRCLKSDDTVEARADLIPPTHQERERASRSTLLRRFDKRLS